MTSETRGVLQFFGVAFLIVAALFAVFSLPFFWQQIQVLHSWPVRQAQVIRSQVVVVPTATHDQLYAAKMEIAYTVDDKPVVASLTSFQSSNYQRTARRAAEFPVGSRCAIRYDPHNPKAARIGAGWNRRFFAVPLITLGGGLLFAAVAGAFFLAARLFRPSATTVSE